MAQASFNGDPTTASPLFKVVRWRSGYDTADVDAFVASIGAGTVTSADIDDVRFRPVAFRSGYDMGEVDRYLDRVQQELRAADR